MNTRPSIPHRVTAPLSVLPVLALLLFTLAGCASMPRMLGGDASDSSIRLDGDLKHEATVVVGRLLVLDVRDPSSKGFAFAGVSFDPTMLRLEGIEEPKGEARARYQFLALVPGVTDVFIKIHQPGKKPEVFKQVTVTVEQ